MIEQVIDEINIGITDLNIFLGGVNGLCEMIQEPFTIEETTVIAKFPALYKGNDHLDYVTNLDYGAGVVFHLNNGNMSPASLETIRAREKRVQRSWPLKCIAIIRRDIYNTDSPYSAQELLTNLQSKISKKAISTLKATLGVERIQVNITSANDDKSQIIAETFENIDFPALHDLMAVRVDYEIVISGPENCFLTYDC